MSATATIILGMHRSGTSLLARCLGLIGVELGPEEKLLAPSKFNPTGFWEAKAVVEVNDEILAAFGGSWRKLPALPDGWERDARLAALREKAAQIIATDFAGFTSWGFKDPRVCVTLPFWKPLLPKARYVLCLRSPSEVAQSLAHTMRFDEAVALWLRYVEASLRASAGEWRTLVFYEDLLENTATELRRIATALGIAFSEAALARAAAFSKKELRHNRASAEALMHEPLVPFAAKALYAALRGHDPEVLAAAGVAEMSRTAALVAARGISTANASTVVAPADPLHRVDPERYFSWGADALRIVRQAADAARRDGFARILDAQSGFGRVTRWLRADFPSAQLTARDPNPEAAEFCAREFRTTNSTGPFDLIWAGLIFTQLAPENWSAKIAQLRAELAPAGVLLFTTNGRWTAAKRGVALADGVAWRDGAAFCALRQAMDRAGFRVLCAAERGWLNYHDTVALTPEVLAA